MDTYLKRYIWIIHLCLIAFVGHSASLLVGHFLLGQGESVIDRFMTSSRSQASTGLGDKRVTRKQREKWAEVISNRNLFNANPPGPEDELAKASEVEEVKKPTGALPEPDEECEASDLAITIQSMMIAEPIDLSTVSLKYDNESRILTLGDSLDGRELVTMQWTGLYQRLVFLNEGQYECVENGTKKVQPKGRTAYTPPKPQARSGGSRFQDGIKEVSPGHFEVDRAMLDEQLNDLDNLIRQARVIPHYKRGKPAGFKIVGIRSSSIFRHLGLKTGDVLTSVGGEELTSINKALVLFEKLKSSDNLSLEFERRGKATTHEYAIR